MRLRDETALGLLETRGLVAAVEAADAMLKAAEVRLVSAEQTVAALITIQVVGEVAAVQASVDAGREAAMRVGDLVSAHVIPRPDGDVRRMQALDNDRPNPSGGGPQRRGPSIEGDDLESMTVRALRARARATANFPIQGREIARANKALLLRLFREL